MKYDKEFESFYNEIRQGVSKDIGALMPTLDKLDGADEVIINVYRMAFRNVMLQTEDKIQADVTSELRTILKMIPKVADPENENTKKIMGTIEELIAEGDEDIDYVDDISELGVSEEDLEDDPEEK